MAKLLVADQWYSSIASTQRYEAEFERILLSKCAVLFPGLLAARFRRTVESSTDSAIPDYALIDEQYLSWWLVEVELATHSLDGHVIPQVRTLVDAAYGEDEADYLQRANPQLDARRLRTLLRGRSPSVLVVVNESRPDWNAPLEALGARLAVFEIFRDDLDRYVFRLNGFAPRGSVASVTRCYLDRRLPFLLRVESPNVLGTGRDVTLEYRGTLTEWERIEIQDGVFLHPRSSFPIRHDVEYQIAVREDGEMRISVVPRQKAL